jgi:hypothetical protein
MRYKPPSKSLNGCPIAENWICCAVRLTCKLSFGEKLDNWTAVKIIGQVLVQSLMGVVPGFFFANLLVVDCK